ncbi:TIGR00366 family protein, partial [Stutzerimonas nitrititolerans]
TEAVPITETLFTPLNLTIVALLFIGLPLLNRAMHPRQNAKVADPAKLVESRAEQPLRETPAQRLDDSRIL